MEAAVLSVGLFDVFVAFEPVAATKMTEPIRIRLNVAINAFFILVAS